MKLFWSSVALSTGVYQGRPMPKHLPLPIDARHFDRWLEIFEATARDLCPPAAADHFIVRARRIAESLNWASPTPTVSWSAPASATAAPNPPGRPRTERKFLHCSCCFGRIDPHIASSPRTVFGVSRVSAYRFRAHDRKAQLHPRSAVPASTTSRAWTSISRVRSWSS